MKGFLLIDAHKNVLEIPPVMYDRLIKLAVTPLEKAELHKSVKMCATRSKPMYKKFSPEEVKDAEDGQSLDVFLKARGYAVIRQLDLGKCFMNIVNGVPENKSEKEMSDFMKKHPLDVMLTMAVLSMIEKRIFKDCNEEANA